jgi:hypothetical protein
MSRISSWDAERDKDIVTRDGVEVFERLNYGDRFIRMWNVCLRGPLARGVRSGSSAEEFESGEVAG